MMKANCGCDTTNVVASHSMQFNFKLDPTYTEYEGRETIIVPVVLLKQTVVNERYVDASELQPEAWNGVPVTLNHPAENGSFVSVNASPKILSKFSIGRIFNAKLEGDKLKAEAWLDVERVTKIMPELIDMIKANDKIQVSTGYFSSDERAKGTYGGKKYIVKSHDLKPNHLAILPNEEGACNWADGCGIRANEDRMQTNDNEKSFFDLLKEKLGLTDNRRGSDMNPQQMVADLVSSDKTPFGPDNTYALQSLDTEALMGLCNTYGLRSNAAIQTNGANEVKKPTVADLVTAGYDKATAELMVNAIEKKPETEGAIKTLTAADIATLISNSNTELLQGIPAIVAKTLAEQRKPELVAKVVANTTYTKEQAEKMTVEQLDLIANSVKPVPQVNYSGRNTSQPVINKDDKVAKEMVPPVIDWKAAAGNGKAN